MWCTCSQLVVITPQHHSYFPVSNVNTCEPSFQGHFLFMFLNIGYHHGPNPLLLESVFNQIKDLYWRIFLVGEKNKLIEKLITETSLVNHLVFPSSFLKTWFWECIFWGCLFTSAMHMSLQ